MTGDSPLHPDLLPPERVAAIVNEARRAAALPHPDTPVTALPTRWETLNAEALAALIRMPQWQTIPESVMSDDTRGLLLQQAAAWDLFDFRRPSDAARLWAHLWPESVSRPVEHDERFPFGIGYMPDPSWAVRPRAMAAIIDCLPHQSWELNGDVLVESSRRPWARSDDGPDAFRYCVGQAAQFLEPDSGYGPPHDPPHILVAVIDLLKDRFTGQIAADRCSRPGPDGCLVLLDALLSLDQDDPRLPGLFRLIEPDFRLDSPIEMPTIPDNAARDESPAHDAALEVPEGEALRRMVFLRLKLRQLLHRPENWPAGELDRTLSQAARAGIALNAARSGMSESRTRRVYGIDRVAWLRDLVTPRVARTARTSQRMLGTALAHGDACASLGGSPDDWAPFTGTADLWTAYRQELLRMHRSCE